MLGCQNKFLDFIEVEEKNVFLASNHIARRFPWFHAFGSKTIWLTGIWLIDI